MIDYRADGLELWFESENARTLAKEPSPPYSVTVGVRPANFANSVEVEYRINGGPTRHLSARPLEDSRFPGTQLFQAVFPHLSPGSTVEYAPAVRSLGRRIGPRLGSPEAASFSVPRAADTSSGASPMPAAGSIAPLQLVGGDAAFPYTIERLARVHAQLAPAKPVGVTPDGFRVNFDITGGRITGDRLKATVEPGGSDCLRIREDGVGIVAVRTTLRTEDGAVIYADYSGVLELGERGYQDVLNGRYPSRPRVCLAPRFLCASPAYGWLNRLQCLGIGYVTMAKLEVDYDLYAAHLPDATERPAATS